MQRRMEMVEALQCAHELAAKAWQTPIMVRAVPSGRPPTLGLGFTYIRPLNKFLCRVRKRILIN